VHGPHAGVNAETFHDRISNERTQGAEHQHLAAFPWVRLSFDRHSYRSAKSLFPPDRSLCCPSVLEPVSNA
ncbi:MAG: hypothetical protein AAAB20_09905, partial [Rhizobium sp.]|uniref:hypothetical protein n=1 Tax=Rhizobium sp. TaxID=391 RepID=UPI0030F15C3F